MREQIRTLLRQNDEAGSYETPSGFDYPALERRARSVESRLHTALHERTTFEGASHNQDASFSIAICLHSYERQDAKGLYLPCLRFSNFGGLVSLTWSDMVPIDRVEAIIGIVEEAGFHFIPESDLEISYDGVMTGKFETWWVRYFDWL